MAQAAVGVGTSGSDLVVRGGRITALFKAVRDGLSSAYRTSREREQLGRAISTAQVGRETGVKC
jgi:hypothetical protein